MVGIRLLRSVRMSVRLWGLLAGASLLLLALGWATRSGGASWGALGACLLLLWILGGWVVLSVTGPLGAVEEGLGGIASHAISPTLYARMPFDAQKDFTLVTGIWRLPNLLVVNNDIPARSVPELIAFLKANPGKYSYASAGAGTTLHIAGAMLATMAGVEMTHVPYRGSAAAYPDIIAGRVHMILDNIPGALAQAREGRVRALGVTSADRSPVVPDVPSIAETLPGYDMSSWTCICGPAGMPAPVVQRMSDLARRALESEDLKRQYLEQGSTAWWTTPEQIADFRTAEERRLAPIIRASGARVE